MAVIPAALTAKSKILTPEFRVSYANIWTPQTNDQGKQIWGLTAIFEPDADLSQLRKLVELCKAAKWPAGVKGKFRSPFRKGVQIDEEHPNGFDLSKNPEYEGKIIVPFRSYGRPVDVIKPDKTRFAPEDQHQFYSGCYAEAFVTVFAYDNPQGGKGVSFGLSSIRKRRDGEPFVAAANAEADFAEIAPIVVDNSAEFDDI